MSTTSIPSVDDFFNANDFDDEKLESYSFPEVGAVAKGVIAKPPKVVEVESKFGKGMQSKLLIVLEAEGVRRNLWVSGQMATAIKEAFAGAGAPGLAVGGTLAVQFASTKDVGKGNPMKVFRAKYEPPAPKAAAAVDDFFDDAPASAPAAVADDF